MPMISRESLLDEEASISCQNESCSFVFYERKKKTVSGPSDCANVYSPKENVDLNAVLEIREVSFSVIHNGKP